MSLYLVGMRAVGKSTAGRLAAHRLGAPFVDTDEEVERAAGQSVAALFEQAGEPAFRSFERDAVLETLGRQGQLVAVGAGAVRDARVRAALTACARVVWLAADLELVRSRLLAVPRPSLTGRAPAEEAADLLAEREPLYRACASVRIDVTHSSVSEVADELERIWAMPAHHFVR